MCGEPTVTEGHEHAQGVVCLVGMRKKGKGSAVSDFFAWLKGLNIKNIDLYKELREKCLLQKLATLDHQ